MATFVTGSYVSLSMSGIEAKFGLEGTQFCGPSYANGTFGAVADPRHPANGPVDEMCKAHDISYDEADKSATPAADRLAADERLIEAITEGLSNDDIGFVHPGQKVKLKFAAFSFQKYGMAEGVVEHVSADAADGFANNAANNAASASDKTGKSAPLAYKALVTLKSMNLETNGERFKLAAGMQTNAEILLGTRSVAEYLLSPVQKAWHEAGRER